MNNGLLVMIHKFNSKDYIKNLAEELIKSFQRASDATTPITKGDVKENAIRKKLEKILPLGIGVGQGFVIDHEGNVSQQQDVILYEKQFCPVFSIEDTIEASYYPCECVIAIGEIKTILNTKALNDCCSKIESVKKLKRLIQPKNSASNRIGSGEFRNYLSQFTMDGTAEEDFNPDQNYQDQIYGFVVYQKNSLKEKTLLQKLNLNLSSSVNPIYLPNIIMSLEKGIFLPYDKNTNKINKRPEPANQYIYASPNILSNFEVLLQELYLISRIGHSTSLKALEKYICGSSSNNITYKPLIL